MCHVVVLLLLPMLANVPIIVAHKEGLPQCAIGDRCDQCRVPLPGEFCRRPVEWLFCDQHIKFFLLLSAFIFLN
jgi:hypothetical protein